MYSEGHFSLSGNELFLNIASPQKGIPSTLFVVTLCSVKGIFLAPYCCFYKGRTSETFRSFSVYIEGHFCWSGNRCLPHIAASQGAYRRQFSLLLCV